MSESMINGGCSEYCSDDKIKEAVCINASRIYDSCSDKDCLEDLPVMLTKAGQCVIDKAATVRLNDVNVCNVSICLQQVPFNKGFYAVDMTFYFDVSLDVYMAPNALPMPVKGLSVFSKRAVLYGSDGSVKVFSSECSDGISECLSSQTRNCPKAVVQVAEPIPLAAKLTDNCSRFTPARIPEAIMRRYGGEFNGGEGEKQVLVSMGIFTIVQLERNVQMLIPAYDFCIPHKECVSSSEDPCELFSSIEFPTNAFFPSRCPSDKSHSCGCKARESTNEF